MVKNRRNHILMIRMFILIAVSMTAQRAWAQNDGAFDNPSQAFTWYQKGSGCIHLKLMLTNSDPYRTLHAATYGLRDADGNKIPIFYIGETNSNESDKVRSDYQNLMPDETLLYITNDNKWSPQLNYVDGTLQPHETKRNGKGNGYAEVDWYYPPRMGGKSYTLYVSAKLWHSGEGESDYVHDIGTMELESAGFETYDIIPGTTSGDEGVMMVPFSSSSPVNAVRGYYTDEDGLRKDIPLTTFNVNTYSGYIRLPATEAHRDLTIRANIKSGEVAASDVSDNPDFPRVLNGSIEIKYQNSMDRVLHNARQLRATVQTDLTSPLNPGSVLLEWTTKDDGVNDILDGDAFLIQRSLTGRLDDYEDIGSVMYDSNDSVYTFRDSTLIEALTPELIDKELGMPLVRYRVVRGATMQLWGVNQNPAIAYVQPQLSTLALLVPTIPSASWSDEEAHKALVKWNYEAGADDRIFVWDSRAEMKLTIRMFNKKGEEIGTQTEELNLDDIAARQKEVRLTRSCSDYRFLISMDAKKSPIGVGTGDIFVTIADKAQYDTFASRVNNGETTLNAILLADIDTGSNVTIAPEADKPYCGNFNGNGHSITIDYQMHSDVAGPFRNVGHGAVIANLTTKGMITTPEKYAGGIVGCVKGGIVSIENCRASLTINMTRLMDDCSHGGVIGLVEGSADGLPTTTYVSNTLFDGEYVHDNSTTYFVTNLSGFVGWRRAGAFVQLAGCHFAQQDNYRGAEKGNSHTFMRGDNDATTRGIIQDCTYKTPFAIVEGRQSDTAPKNACWSNGLPWMTVMKFGKNIMLNMSAESSIIHELYYENLGHIDTESLKAEMQQSSVVLSWKNKDDTPVDYYEVWRRDAQSKDSICIATQLTEMSYEDKTTSPVHTYYYRVRGVNSCEGLSYEDTKAVEGHCRPTGLVQGYLRFADGTGIPGQTIAITSADRTVNETATTDESGFFSKGGLPYIGGTETTYSIAPQLNGFSDVQPLTFGTEPGGNMVTGVVFTVEQSVKFSGYVQYNGTSIPVQGVKFLVDGREVHSAGGPIVSDHEGQFAFRMLPDTLHSIQAVKDGHVFYQKGYYHEDEDTTKLKYAFTTDKAGIIFYDDTRVKLIGRVTGGRDQEALPLGNSLSRNNLGDDLQMVFTLEGDNASRLVWDIQDRNKKERDEVFTHKAHDKKYTYQTTVHTTLNRKVVRPDVHTGEYEVWLPPVKWKIQQITAQGYATLFQDGKTGDVIDLSDSLTLHTDHLEGAWTAADKSEVTAVDVTYYALYNRIYHTPVILDYQQQGYDNFSYLGERYYQARNLMGQSSQVPLCYPVRKTNWPAGKADSLETVYTFGYPVFNIERSYPIKISATERYYYNNNTASDTIDVVRLSGGFVTIQNGMVSSTHRDTLSLDANGEGVYRLQAKQLPYMLTGDDALRTISMTLLMDGTYYEAKPQKVYVLNQFVVPGAKDLLTINKPQLIDILRDPPGGASSATLSKGSTLKYAHDMTWSVKGGTSFTFNYGHSLTSLAAVGIGTILGTISSSDNYVTLSVDLIWTGTGKQAWSYTMTNNVDISTSSSAAMVGADADVYIGTETSYVMKPTMAIRAIPDSMWVQLEGMRAAGRTLEIARGTDANGGVLHLVRDEIVGIQQKLNSTFVHSQSYIVNQLMPELREQCRSLLFTGTKEEAQAIANSTRKNVYLALRQPDDENFAMVNTKKEVVEGDMSWEYYFNTTKDKAEEGINYLVVRPEGDENNEDQVAEFCQSLLYWAAMIAQNEYEKVSATDLVRTFDVDGGSPVSYSEDFSSDYSASGEVKSPLSGGLGKIASSLVGSLANMFNNSKYSHSPKQDNLPHFGVEMPGYKIGVTFGPVLEYDIYDPYSESKKYNRKESFSIGMDRKSHLIFDLLRVKTSVDDVSTTDGKYDVFSNQNFNALTEDVSEEVLHGGTLPQLGKLQESDLRYARSFVYRTRGGATLRPWEGERTTEFYNAGTLLDERTKKVENPVITMDKQSLSGVPIDEPARFKLYLANESEQPEAAYPYFDLILVETSNPNGAKLMMDGMPLSGNPRTIEVHPGQVTEKTIEVWAGEQFDYENLQLQLRSQGDILTYQNVQFSVHYLQTAGGVAISTPGDKWIMNTDAPYDSKYGWYMPVVISGFNKNQKNFDHIEFQYKESTRGDDYWTNLCGYYADSTYYRSASGTKEMIPENGNIVTRFFGEGFEMEKAYDLRAVLFCRNGNGFLTNASKVLSGVKDTRRPKLFGTPEPKDGILGTGDNIVFSFSEPIEHNYLQATTNFEVMGETNETSLQEEPSLLFSGQKSYAESEARRNFADKSVTVEVMVKPDQTGRDMPIFSHGRDGKQLQLWLTKDLRLRAVVDDFKLETQKPIPADIFQRVALVLDNDLKRLSLFTDELAATLDSVTYSGYGPLIFGATNQTDANKRTYYEGRMLQARVWNRAMDLILLNSYGNQLLTGYEMGLTDYYPMNEGRGDYATDQAQGAHLKLMGTSWALPRGMALRLDKTEQRDIKGLQLKPAFMQRTAEQDYTLMFWFKTDNDGRGALLSNGSGRTTDVEAQHKFFIGFEGETLKYRSNGREYGLGNSFSDDRWHHYAMTVNRSHQVASIYVDNALKAQFSTDSLGGMTGKFYLGNMVWQEEGPDNDVIHQQYPLTGYIDGLTLFKQALPASLINRYSSKALGGSEKGLITFLDFNRQERQKNGDFTLQPYARNQVEKIGSDGLPTADGDSVFVDPITDIMNHIDHNIGAPVQAYEELRNLNFSFVGRDHELLVNVDELDSRINKRRMYVTVTDIPDLNGNFMESPATISVFVDRNPLRWGQKTYKRTVGVLANYDFNFDISIVNNSGAPHTYTIDNMPKWLSVSTLTDVIDPKSEQILTFTIGKDINVGTYDHIVYLTDENGLAEPLTLNITVEGTDPEWYVDASTQQYSMSIVARVQIGDDIVTDSRDKVGVFDSMGCCLGVNKVDYDAASAESLVYLTVYDNQTASHPLNFRLWHFETGKTMVLTPSAPVSFKPESFVGSPGAPIVLKAGSQYIQTLMLEPGWNWMSLNVINNDYRDVPTWLKQFSWQEGDMLTDESDNLSLLYLDGQWISNKGTANLSDVVMSVSKSYRVKVGNFSIMELTGDAITTTGDRTISVKPGWNSIGYTPMVNLPVATALADYLDYAENGDVVKSKSEFAMFTVGANGSREWKGNMNYMKPGEGYMLYRKQQTTAQFTYPFFEANATFFEQSGGSQSIMAPAYAANMTLTAVANGILLEEGDRLIAYAGAEQRGEAVVGGRDEPLYLTIAGDKKTPLSFVVERDGDIIATTGEVMTYERDARMGTPDEPTRISFVSSYLLPQHGWYTLQGIKLDQRPRQSGVYIHNGRKAVVR